MKNKFLLVLTFVLASHWVFAAPIPFTSSSKGVAPYLGLYRSNHGFLVDGRTTGWKVLESPPTHPHILVMYKSPKAFKETTAKLSVRVDESKNSKNIAEYLRRWMGLYTRFGFDVLGSQSFVHNGEKAVVVDLIKHGGKKQTRQAIFFRNPKAVVLTCTDHKDNFKNSLESCNKIIRSFSWTQVGTAEVTPTRR